ncbi:MAG: sodium transporter, partial [Agriterribacter sp.]
IFNNYAPQWFGNETLLYTAFPTTENGVQVWRIPFLICMGWAFVFTVIVMVVFSLAGPKINPKAFALDKQMFKLQPSILTMIVIMLLILVALYAKFW